MTKIIHEELSYEITGLLYKTQNELGRFRNEKQYADYFEKLLKDKGMSYQREYRFVDKQNGEEIARCICDFIIEGNIILEFKTKNFIDKEDYYQAQRYLATLNLELGIIVNFRQKRLVPKRILNSQYLSANIRAGNSGHSNHVTDLRKTTGVTKAIKEEDIRGIRIGNSGHSD